MYSLKKLQTALENFVQHWKGKYFYAVENYRDNLEDFTVFYKFPLKVKTIIYTNLNKNFKGKLEGITKNKISFHTEEDAMKSVYLTVREPFQKMVNVN